MGKLAQQGHDSGDENEGDGAGKGLKRKSTALPSNHPAMKKARNAVPAHKKGPRNEIQRPEQILKKRIIEEKKSARGQGRGGRGSRGRGGGSGGGGGRGGGGGGRGG